MEKSAAAESRTKITSVISDASRHKDMRRELSLKEYGKLFNGELSMSFKSLKAERISRSYQAETHRRMGN